MLDRAQVTLAQFKVMRRRGVGRSNKVINRPKARMARIVFAQLSSI
jgi:hypothetical protein